MKTYFRLLSFAKPIEKFAIPYILTTLFAVIFSTLNLALVAPLLTTLFANNQSHAVMPLGAKPALIDIMATFNYYVRYAINNYGTGGALKFVCGTIVISALLGNFFRYLSQRIMENLRVYTLLNLRRTVFNNVMNLHLGFFSNERKGDIISKIASDVQVVQYSVTGTLQVVFKEPLTLITFLAMLFLISPSLTLYSFLIIPFSAFIIARIVKRLKQQAVASQQTYGNMISYLDEALSGIKIIKAFNATGFIKNRFDSENKKYSEITKSMARRQQLASPVSEFLGICMVAGIVLYGGNLVLNQTSPLKPAEFIAFIVLFSQILRPAKAISDSFSNIHQGIAAGERVLSLIDEKPTIIDAPDASTIKDFTEAIRFEDVSFAYQEKAVLSHVDLVVPKGKTVALVGPSGGGKSTMMDLIPRFMDPQSGRITIDGHDIKGVTADSLRGLMGVVNQESVLFNDTIYNNIAFGKPGASPADVEAAARIANAHNFILEAENGYETNVGDRGTKLSGGQRQRICIARAVLTNPPIMLLDEATSALDTESEKLVQDALNNLMKNRTSLIIAHRLSTIQNADIIVVLENGKLIEQGNHQELINKNGLYRKLIDMQTFNEG
ncbi:MULTISPECIES: ABC transporter ATP-binding protein [unclassified Mucilaginibacter]|uniref:ABC transporter ATP-binding protein n=2 Tax=Mucilaginibacter TaxID=423349 RepID=UPI002AC8DCE1|nr:MULTISPECIES: ABC transporter ATP-binding protein [unclassified Mucilaginibacter]MEB0262776.1 ABC transporter ATP-binding protein [Mucilaginibacter sp. 10I4]MEB0280202.1 ABC transporter ATP-binding protein [Mucilaginibacter sp. 10B2]WPX24389.1 ABC transporter ATP-binding protein [Mucilaginibacter sp. 5C4]